MTNDWNVSARKSHKPIIVVLNNFIIKLAN